MAPKTKAKPKSTSQVAAPEFHPEPEAEADPGSSISFEDLFTSLDKHIKASDYKQIIKVADEILCVALAEADALHCKVAALILSD